MAASRDLSDLLQFLQLLSQIYMSFSELNILLFIKVCMLKDETAAILCTWAEIIVSDILLSQSSSNLPYQS